MISVRINGSNTVTLSETDETVARQFFADAWKTDKQRHELLCKMLKVGRYIPGINRGGFILTATYLEIFDDQLKSPLAFGNWHECYNCATEVSAIRIGRSCAQCGAQKMPNFKQKV